MPGQLRRGDASRLVCQASLLLKTVCDSTFDGKDSIGWLLDKAPETVDYLFKGKQVPDSKRAVRAAEKVLEALLALELMYPNWQKAADPVAAQAGSSHGAPAQAAGGRHVGSMSSSRKKDEAAKLAALPLLQLNEAPQPSKGEVIAADMWSSTSKGRKGVRDRNPGSWAPLARALQEMTLDSPVVCFLWAIYLLFFRLVLKNLPHLIASTILGAGLLFGAMVLADPRLLARCIFTVIRAVPEVFVFLLKELTAEFQVQVFGPDLYHCPDHCTYAPPLAIKGPNIWPQAFGGAQQPPLPRQSNETLGQTQDYSNHGFAAQSGQLPAWGPTLQPPAQPPAWLTQIISTAVTAYLLRPPAPVPAADR